tara:strand:- start:1178 stop:1327 length:150 start_codon:yes stop_codon:yes gene_type:complete
MKELLKRFNLWPPKKHIATRKHWQNSSDAEALASDWQAIGTDIKRSIKR